VNQKIWKEGTPALYEHCLKFESTTTLADWLSETSDAVKARLTNLEIKNYIKTVGLPLLRYRFLKYANVFRLLTTPCVVSPVRSMSPVSISTSAYSVLATQIKLRRSSGRTPLSFSKQ
jgi:hypothetical protein